MARKIEQESALGISVDIPEHVKQNDYRLCLLESDLEDVKAACLAASVISIDTETSGLDPIDDFLVGVSLSWAQGKAAYIPIAHVAGPNVPAEAVRDLLTALVDKTIVYHSAMFDVERLRRWLGVPLRYENYHDTLAMCYRFDASAPVGLKPNTMRYLGYQAMSLEDLFGKNKEPKFHMLDIDTALWYAAADPDNTLRLFHVLYPQIQKLRSLPYQMDISLIPVIARHNWSGVLVNVPYLEQAEQEYAKLIEEQVEYLREVSGKPDFNVNAPLQVQKLLYETLQLPVLARTPKTNAPSTDQRVIAQLALRHPAVGRVMLAKSLGKFKGYCENFREASRVLDTELYEQHGLATILPSYMLFRVPTGRLACSEPALQQIPRERNEEPGWEKAPSIRAAFRPRPGFIFLEGDFSQIELRIMAAESGARAFLKAFQEDRDVHSETWALMKRKPVSAVTKDERQRAKAVNFGLLYGQSPAGLAETLRCSEEEAAGLHAEYFSAVPEVRLFMERVVAEARTNRGISTRYGHFRPLPDITSPVEVRRQEAERQSINTVIQGTAADILKLALIRLEKMLLRWEGRVHEVFTTHDSVLFEVAVDVDLGEFVTDLKKAMEIVVSETYPRLPIEIKTGVDYGHMVDWKGSGEDGNVGAESCEDVVESTCTEIVAEEGQGVVVASQVVTHVVVLESPDMTPDEAQRLAVLVKEYRSEDSETKLRLDYGGKMVDFPGFYRWGSELRQALSAIGVYPAEPEGFSILGLHELFR